MGRSLFEVTLVLLCAGATVPAQSWQPRKAPPVAGVVLEEEQDFSWFPHEQRPPYVSALVQEDGPEDTADTIDPALIESSFQILTELNRRLDVMPL